MVDCQKLKLLENYFLVLGTVKMFQSYRDIQWACVIGAKLRYRFWETNGARITHMNLGYQRKYKYSSIRT